MDRTARFDTITTDDSGRDVADDSAAADAALQHVVHVEADRGHRRPRRRREREAAPKPLAPFTTSFTTFAPEQIGQSDQSYSSPAIVVLGDRGYLAVPMPNQSALKIYDVSDPTELTEIVPDPLVAAIGYPYDLVGEQESPITGGRLLGDDDRADRRAVPAVGRAHLRRVDRSAAMDRRGDAGDQPDRRHHAAHGDEGRPALRRDLPESGRAFRLSMSESRSANVQDAEWRMARRARTTTGC